MNALDAGQPFPEITVPVLGGAQVALGGSGARGWHLVVVYRGLHCPLCKIYLGKLETMLPEFHAADIDVTVVSGDPADKAAAFRDEVGLTMPVAYGLSVEQMRALGLYVSSPRSAAETDRPYPEPGLFAINDERQVQILDISNAPFARPELERILSGISFIRANNYPIRGTHTG